MTPFSRQATVVNKPFLESKGFVRCAADADRRKKRIEPTQKALERFQQVRQHFLETEALITASMTEAERDTLCSLLDRVIANIRQVGGLDPCDPPKEESHV